MANASLPPLSPAYQTHSEYQYLNAGYGVLNPVADTHVDKNFSINGGMDGLAFSRESAIQNMSTNALGSYASTGRMIGICLRIENAISGLEPGSAGSWTAAAQEIANSSQSIPLLSIRVRVPEMHAEKDIPKNLPLISEPSPDHDIINTYPQFIATDTTVSSLIPRPGDLVWVTYQNGTTMQGPIYLGPVDQSKVSINSSAASFSPSLAFLGQGTGPFAVNGATGNSPGVYNGIVVPGASQTYPNSGQPTITSLPGVKVSLELFGKLKSSKRRKKIAAVVLHDGSPAGNFADIIPGWQRKDVSSHYTITLDGTLYPLVTEDRYTWHAGGSSKTLEINSRSIGVDLVRCPEYGAKGFHKSTTRTPNETKGTKAGPWPKNATCDDTSNSLGGHVGGRKDGPYTQAQSITLKKLLESIQSRHDVPIIFPHIIPHKAVHTSRQDPVTFQQTSNNNFWEAMSGGKLKTSQYKENSKGQCPKGDKIYSIPDPPGTAPPQVAENTAPEIGDSTQVATAKSINYPGLVGNSELFPGQNEFLIHPPTTLGSLGSNALTLTNKVLNRGIYGVPTDIKLIEAPTIAPPGSTANNLPDFSLTENRVRVYSYGYMNRDDDNLAYAPTVRGKRNQKLHILAAKRLELLNLGWLKYISSKSDTYLATKSIDGPFRISQGWIKHKYKDDFSYYSEKMEKKYGSVSEAEKYEPFHSAYETGLVFNIGNNGIGDDMSVKGLYKETLAWEWLVKNAYLYGIYPCSGTPCRWEVQVPRASWFSGKEFANSESGLVISNVRYPYAIYVIEKSMQTNRLTSSPLFKKEIFY